MKRATKTLVMIALLSSSCERRADVTASSQKLPEAASPMSRELSAARAFLATLNDTQRAAVFYPADDDTQRKRWSNFPTGVVARGGLRMRDLSDAQRSSTTALLRVVLSTRGLEKVEQVRQADDAFKANPNHGPKGGPKGGWPRGGDGGMPPVGFSGPPDGAPHRDDGGRPGGPSFGVNGGPTDLFGSDLYYISFVGTPADDHPWMLQFGGHHLALNLTIDGEKGTLTPSLTGAQPSHFESGGKTIRPLARENDEAFALPHALDDDECKQATLTVGDLVLGPGHDGETIVPEGLPVSKMTAPQRKLLLGLIGEWVGIAEDKFARARMIEIEADLEQTYFAWSGPAEVAAGQNGSSYYRIQGPRLVIKFAPQRDDPTGHVHTIYRDPTNDYGRRK